jgi:hypothetical protein
LIIQRSAAVGLKLEKRSAGKLADGVRPARCMAEKMRNPVSESSATGREKRTGNHLETSASGLGSALNGAMQCNGLDLILLPTWLLLEQED